MDGLEEQVFTFKMYLEKLPFQADTNKLCDLLEALLPVETAFPIIKKAIVIAMTFGHSGTKNNPKSSSFYNEPKSFR